MLNAIAAIHGVGTPAVTNSYESIATVTVGSGGSSSISFSSIPSTYKHLQLRVSAQVTRATFGRGGYLMQFNSVTGANYSHHYLEGDGSTATAVGTANATSLQQPYLATTTATSTFGVSVIDILDYANTNKYKTTRSLGGLDHNGLIGGFGGVVGLYSGLWLDTAAINSIQLTTTFNPFTQYSQFALYGIKG